MRQGIFGRSIVGRAMEILLVEDSFEDARTAMQVLEDGNVRCRVTLVRDGEEALAFLRREAIFARAPRPDLIMLDLDIPKRDGRQVLAEIRADESLKNIPVVVLTGTTISRMILAADQLEVLEYLAKPLSPDRFVGLVKSLHYSLLTELVESCLA